MQSQTRSLSTALPSILWNFRLRKWLAIGLLTAALSLWTLVGCISLEESKGGNGSTAFRVRSDFEATLNSQTGWAGAINENVTIMADQPFRLRFTTEAGSESFGLQYRRNGEAWIDVEAHDFPYPSREMDIEHGLTGIKTIASDWEIVSGDLSQVEEGETQAFHLTTRRTPAVSLFEAPWEITEVAMELLLPASSATPAGLFFAYQDENNYCQILLDPNNDQIRVRRFVDGKETSVHEQAANIPLDTWLALEVELEDGETEVNFEDDKVVFKPDIELYGPTKTFGLQVAAGGQAAFREPAIAGESKTPRVSIISCPGFENGDATTPLLSDSTDSFFPGSGIAMAEATTPHETEHGISEFEWAVVVRRFVDEALTNESGDQFEFRMTSENGITSATATLSLSIPVGHLGGTYVETPGRIGPFAASNGDLYFVMEPAETDNLFMIVKSSDQGRTWQEVDGENRPQTGDLEAVDVRQIGDTLHMIHQVTEAAFYHAFHTSDHKTQPDSWGTTDELAASTESVAQGAAFEIRDDGSLVTFYVGETIEYSIRSSEGSWGESIIMDSDSHPAFGPKTVLGANGIVHLAYYRANGSIGYRSLSADGTLSDEMILATDAGISDAHLGAVLPLLYIQETETVIVIYRLEDGYLWERRIGINGDLSTPKRVSDRKVVTDAVDSQQAGADAVVNGSVVYVLFIDQETRSIFYTNDRDGWQASKIVVDDILGSWVRGSVYPGQAGKLVYGFVYDAGSDGGAGLNRYAEIELDDY